MLARLVLLIGLCALAPSVAVSAPPEQAVREAARKFEGEIRKLEALDRAEKDPDNAILFVGSSSVRLWDSMAQDMAPFPTIRRGYGGAKYSDLNVFAARLVHPHRFRALVLFAANDGTGKSGDPPPGDVAKDVRSIIDTVRAKHPDAPIFLVEITPSPQRWEAWPKIRAVNAALAELCSDLPRVHWIATSSSYLGPDEKPRAELFVADRLHQNAAGYQLWSQLIKRRLDEVLNKSDR